MVMHPVGPLPASTYWRRRAVLLAVVVLLLLVARSCGGDGSSNRTGASPHPTPAAGTTTTTTGPSPTPRPSSQVTASASLCPDTAITLSTTTDADSYAVGATPKITLVVKNVSTVACRRDLGAGAVELLVFSGADRVWSSDDCSPSAASAVTALGPGGTQAVVKTWPGVRSAPSCGGSKAAAKAGTYRVVARLGTLRVEGAVFRLRA